MVRIEVKIKGNPATRQGKFRHSAELAGGKVKFSYATKQRFRDPDGNLIALAD
jgi:hypothetical protein